MYCNFKPKLPNSLPIHPFGIPDYEMSQPPPPPPSSFFWAGKGKKRGGGRRRENHFLSPPFPPLYCSFPAQKNEPAHRPPPPPPHDQWRHIWSFSLNGTLGYQNHSHLQNAIANPSYLASHLNSGQQISPCPLPPINTFAF